MHDHSRQTETAGDKSDSEIHKQASERASKVLRQWNLFTNEHAAWRGHIHCSAVCMCVERYNLVV